MRLSHYKFHAIPILIRKGINVEGCTAFKEVEILEP